MVKWFERLCNSKIQLFQSYEWKWNGDKLKPSPSLNQGLFLANATILNFPTELKKKVKKILPSRQKLTLGSLWPLCIFLLNFLIEIFSKVQTDHFLFFGFWSNINRYPVFHLRRKKILIWNSFFFKFFKVKMDSIFHVFSWTN